MTVPLSTVGHGPEDRDRLGTRLEDVGVDQLVDVRRFPHRPAEGAVLGADGAVHWPG